MLLDMTPPPRRIHASLGLGTTAGRANPAAGRSFLAEVTMCLPCPQLPCSAGDPASLAAFRALEMPQYELLATAAAMAPTCPLDNDPTKSSIFPMNNENDGGAPFEFEFVRTTNLLCWPGSAWKRARILRSRVEHTLLVDTPE